MRRAVASVLLGSVTLVGFAFGRQAHRVAPDPASAATTAAAAALPEGPAPLASLAPETAEPRPPTTGVLPGTPPAPAGCVDLATEDPAPSTELRGTTFVDETFAHPTHGAIRPFILRLDRPLCVQYPGGEAVTVHEVHLAASDALQLKPLVGKHIRVRGEPFQAMTAWHARPVVVLTSQAAVIGGAAG